MKDTLKTNDQVNRAEAIASTEAQNTDAASVVPTPSPATTAAPVQRMVRFLRFIRPAWPYLGLGLFQLVVVALFSVMLSVLILIVKYQDVHLVLGSLWRLVQQWLDKL